MFGLTGIAAGARGIVKILFFIAVATFLIILVFGLFLGVLVFQPSHDGGAVDRYCVRLQATFPSSGRPTCRA